LSLPVKKDKEKKKGNSVYVAFPTKGKKKKFSLYSTPLRAPAVVAGEIKKRGGEKKKKRGRRKKEGRRFLTSLVAPHC